jgi:hypothetical protein
MIDLERDLSFGFEQTFTVPEWWTEPGFVVQSDTPLKREKMLALTEAIVKVQGGHFVQSLDFYKNLQYETFFPDGRPSFVVTMDPGSIEVKTQPARLEELTAMMRPLFEAAERAGCVTYRNWWYGVRGGTEGGCHINTGGFTAESNPWKRDPRLLLQYAGFLQNHPEAHYPFMGLDTGPGGNAVRMDEHDEPGLESVVRWRAMRERMNAGERPTAEQFAEFFKGTRIYDDRHSAPSFHKFKAPLYLIEDRAQETFRSPEEAELVCSLKMKALQKLQAAAHIEDLGDVPSYIQHRQGLTLPVLWEQFEVLARSLGLDPKSYLRFFERQFPRLSGGVAVPQKIRVHEGRRPRVIIGQEMRWGLVVSRKIDTRFKRLEIHWPEEAGSSIVINGHRLQGRAWKDPTTSERLCAVALDLCTPAQEPLLNLSVPGESAAFHLNDMMFKAPSAGVPSEPQELDTQEGYANVENLGSFFT